MGWSETILPIENITCFLRFCSRCRGMQLQKKSASSLLLLLIVKPEPVLGTRKLMHRGTVFFALRSCPVRVCSWTRLPPYLCRWFWKIGVCRRTSGWHALLLKHLLPATGQIMGFMLETGIFCCLVPDRKIPIGYCFGCCCFIFGTSPPVYEMGDAKSEEAADRRRGLLKKVCSQERVISIRSNRPWSDSTSFRKPVLRNWMLLFFLSSTSACYWDPEVTFQRHRFYYPICRSLVTRPGLT